MKLSRQGRRDCLLSFVLGEFDLHLFTDIKETGPKDDPDYQPKELSHDDYKTIRLDKSMWKLDRVSSTVRCDTKKFKFKQEVKDKIKGFYLTRPDADDCLYAESFSDGPYGIDHEDGGSVKVTVVLVN